MALNNNSLLDSTEEIIFYLDLSTDFLKKKYLIRGLEIFIEENEKSNKKSLYGLVFFKMNKELFTIYNQKPEKILETIKEIWDEREKDNNYFENGLYEILAYIFKKSRKIRKLYRILVLSDAPSNLSEEYNTALYDLILKAKNFSTYIDIIRVGDQKFYSDVVKLKIMTSETFGGTLYCRNEKHLKKYLSSLVRSREEYSFISSYKEKISPKDYAFFERLATDLISLSPLDYETCFFCDNEVCEICEDPNDELHKCFNCNACFHICCIAKYSAENNIGVPYIFRCPKCEALLKIDEDLIQSFNKMDELVKTSEFLEKNIEDKSNQLIEEKDQKTTEIIPEERKSKETLVRIGGYFGPEIKINTKKTSNNQVTTQAEKNSSKSTPEKIKKISITSLHPPKSKFIIKFCPICGKNVKDASICPYCGSKIE